MKRDFRGWPGGVSPRKAALCYMSNICDYNTLIAAIGTHPAVRNMVANLAAWPGAKFAHDSVWWKEPTAEAVPFHQDVWSMLSILDPPDFMTCWISLEDVSVDAGPLQYVLGSNQWPLKPELARLQDPRNYTAGLAVMARELGAEPEIISVCGTAGTCAFHTGRTWHGSPPNRSGRSRLGIAFHYVRSDARFLPERKVPPEADGGEQASRFRPAKVFHYAANGEDTVNDSRLNTSGSWLFNEI